MTRNSNSNGTNDTRRLLRWFGWLVAIGPIHMGEQFLFGLDTLDEMRDLLGSYYSLFSNQDVATVALVIFVVTLVQSLLLATLAGGRWRLFAAALFGAMGIGESHHIIQTLVQGRYFPGFVTAFAYVWIGAMVLRCVAAEWRRSPQSGNAQVATA